MKRLWLRERKKIIECFIKIFEKFIFFKDQTIAWWKKHGVTYYFVKVGRTRCTFLSVRKCFELYWILFCLKFKSKYKLQPYALSPTHKGGLGQNKFFFSQKNIHVCASLKNEISFRELFKYIINIKEITFPFFLSKLLSAGNIILNDLQTLNRQCIQWEIIQLLWVYVGRVKQSWQKPSLNTHKYIYINLKRTSTALK